MTLRLGDAPENIVQKGEAYRITVNSEGVEITGFGATGLYYGVSSFVQMSSWDSQGVELPAVEILDWPDNAYRAYKEECRYGSNVMEKADWLQLIDDVAAKKLNRLSLGIYGCWVVQYDGKLAEYLYMPIKAYPQLKTPMTVKYYSPLEDRWYNYETLPPIFKEDFLGELFRYAKDRGIDIIPGINSFGHNKLFPRMLPEVSPKDENGDPTKTGFCTSSEETYRLLFSIYDQIIDDYLIPNEIDSFNILLDEVKAQFGADEEHPEIRKSPWCQCERCKDRDKGDIFIEHAIKLISHLKARGMKSVTMSNDMIVGSSKVLGYLGDRMMKAVYEAGVQDVLVLGWWDYEELKEDIQFDRIDDTLGMRVYACPWNGYYIWSLLLHSIRNIKLLADMNHESKCSEGMHMYAMWDKSFDRTHDCFADLCWNYVGSGQLEDITARYVRRHFAPMVDEVLHGFRLMEWITEKRKEKKDPEKPLETVISNYRMLLLNMSYYKFCYYKARTEYPQHFPGNALKQLLPFRMDYERAMYSVAAMAKEAIAIFKEAAVTPGCDADAANRMVYECENYLVLVEDWMAFLKIYDLTQGRDQKKILPIAQARKNARLALMKRCEQTKEKWAQRGAIMRNHSVFMQCFADIERYIASTEEPQLDLLDITPIMSPENWMLR